MGLVGWLRVSGVMKGWIEILIMIGLRLSEIVLTYQVVVSSTATEKKFCRTRLAQRLQPWFWSFPPLTPVYIISFSHAGAGIRARGRIL